MRVMCLAQEHNAVPWPGLKCRPFDPESNTLTIRPPCIFYLHVVPRPLLNNFMQRLLHGKYNVNH